jgi:hypothetical protein
MATTTPQIRKKLYFDFNIGGTATRAIFACTQFRAGMTMGERYNGALQALEALTGSSPSGLKAQRAVSAYAVPANNPTTAITSVGGVLYVDFIGPTIGNGTGGITRIAYQTVGGTLFQKAGQDAIYGTVGGLRHFAVRVRRSGLTSGAVNQTIRGTVYVSRQHSIEV